METLHAIRELAPSLPIVVLSGSVTDALAIEAILAGAQDVLQKDAVRSEQLERAVLHSIARYRASMTASTSSRFLMGGFTASMDGIVTKFGPGIELLMGGGLKSSTKPFHISQFLDPSEHAQLESMLRRVSEHNEPEHTLLETAEGMHSRRVLLSLFPVGNMLQGSLAPAGEHVPPPADLVSSEEKYRILVENSQDGVFIVIDSKFVFANKAFAGMLGYTPDEITGLSMREFIAPEDERFVIENYRKRMAGEEVDASYEFRLRNREGNRLQVLMSVGRIEFQNRVAAIGTVKDITREHRMADLNRIHRRIAERVGKCTSMQEMADIVLAGLLHIESVEVAAMFLHGEDGLRPLGFRGFVEDFTAAKTDDMLMTFFDEVRASLSPLFLERSALREQAQDAILSPLGINTVGILPVVDSGQGNAVIVVASLTSMNFDTDVQHELAAIASMLGGILARVFAQDALRESEMLHRAVVEKSYDAILIIDGLSVLFVNDRASTLMGYTNAEILASDPFSLIHEEDRRRIFRMMQTRFTGEGPPPIYEARMVCKDGALKTAEFAASQIRYQGTPATMVTIRDVTERRQHEELKRHSEALIHAAGFAATRFLRAGDWEPVLNGVLDTFGTSATVDRVVLYKIVSKEDGTAILQRHSEWISNVYSPFRSTSSDLRLDAALARWYERLASGAAIADVVAHLSLPERMLLGEDELHSIAVLPVFTGDVWYGALRFDVFSERRPWLMAEIEAMSVCAGTLGAAIQRRLTEQQLIESRDRAERGDKIRQAFISNMSHEIRTPLNIILGYVGLLNNLLIGKDTKESNEYDRAITEASHRLISTVDSVINISRYQAGDLKPVYGVFRFDVLVAERAECIQPAAIEKKLIVQILNEVGEILIDSDQELLRKAIDHVLDNAVKFTEQGDISIRIFRAEPWICLEVSDTGIGIDPENIESVFEPYMQEDMGYTRAYEGIGLGLTIALVYVSALDGAINIRSVKGEGTVLTINLPSARSTT